MAKMGRVVAPGGGLLFVVPLGSPRVEFYAHHIYSPGQVLERFPDFSLVEFVLIPDQASDGHLVVDPPAELIARQNYGCGCFWLKKWDVD